MIENETDRNMIRMFFIINKEWIYEHNLYQKDNILMFKEMFINYINENNCSDNFVALAFLECIDNELQRHIPHRMMALYAMAVPPSKELRFTIRNLAFTEWYQESLVVYEISRGQANEFKKSLEPVIRHNQKVLKQSYMSAKDVIVK